MWLNDYRLFSKEERLNYLKSQKMTTGIPYFGGKSRIGKFIYNTIFNMAVTMKKNGDEPKIFIDSFTGGGKMGLSMPNGWVSTIVMNDLDYGVYAYYISAKDHHRELLAMIDKLLDGMDERLFWVCITTREDKKLEPIVAGAMTYVAAALSFNNMLDVDSAQYKPTMGDNNEKTELDKVRKRAHTAVVKVNQKLNSQSYIIENLDYRELIKKYNGLDWEDSNGETRNGISAYKNIGRNILWYFDPPYYQYCLAGTDAAPYANSFEEEDTIKMTDILSGKDSSCGELFYFIKSDYNPKVTLETAEREIASGKVLSNNQKNTYLNVINHKDIIAHIFDDIENEPFYAFSVGSFDKGAIKDGEVSVGDEWVWCKGLPEEYSTLGKYFIS